jgi:glycosyltransferase involved in cell wall biosynthesis
MTHTPRLVLVIPAYNEAGTIRKIAIGALGYVHDVVIVDDGSNDATSDQALDLPVQIIRHETNCGKSRSLVDGCRAALALGADFVITLDGDGQHLPQDIPKLLAESAKHPTAIIIGSRLHDKTKIPRARYHANRFANFWIAWTAGYPIRDSQSGFRVYPAAALRRFIDRMEKRSGFVFESEILIVAAWSNILSRPVPIPAIYPVAGRRSHFRPIRDIALIVLMVAGHLLSRRMHLRGLIASLRTERT